MRVSTFSGARYQAVQSQKPAVNFAGDKKCDTTQAGKNSNTIEATITAARVQNVNGIIAGHVAGPIIEGVVGHNYLVEVRLSHADAFRLNSPRNLTFYVKKDFHDLFTSGNSIQLHVRPKKILGLIATGNHEITISRDEFLKS